MSAMAGTKLDRTGRWLVWCIQEPASGRIHYVLTQHGQDRIVTEVEAVAMYGDEAYGRRRVADLRRFLTPAIVNLARTTFTVTDGPPLIIPTERTQP
jgi:hypothetical protein